MAELAAAVVQAGKNGEGGGADSFYGKILSVMGDVTATTRNGHPVRERPTRRSRWQRYYTLTTAAEITLKGGKECSKSQFKPFFLQLAFIEYTMKI